MNKIHKPAVLTLILFLTFFFFSCEKDSPSQPSGPKTYFPTTLGSYWIYLNYDLDSLGIKIPNTENYDTSKIIGSKNINGKMATVIETRNSEGNIDTSYFAYENNKIYTLLSFFQNEFIPVGNSNQWVIVADFNSTSWSILSDTTLPSFDVPGIGTMTPTISIQGKKGNSTNIVVKGKAIPSQEFLNTFVMKIKLQIPNVPLPINLSFNVVLHLWFGENVGLVQRQLDPFKIEIPLIGGEQMDGNKSELIDYSIK
ncbi:MAG: hypothetical protein N2517_02890 [Ignavibacteria bacterium]|nr:hypothetical protein [Ignavibacteria bacterium]